MRRAREFRDLAWNTLRGRYWWAVLAALIAGLLGGYAAQSPVTLNLNAEHLQSGYNFVQAYTSTAIATELFHLLRNIAASFVGLAFTYGIALFIVGSAIELGYNLYNVSLYQRAGNPKIEMIFSRFPNFGNALLLRFLMALKTFLWTLLFIVPGIVAAYRYALAPYLMAEHPELSATEAIEQSKQLMAGHKGRLFCLELSFIGWYILVAFTGGLGWVFLAPYVKAAITAFYYERTERLPLQEGFASPVGSSSAATSAPTTAPAGESVGHELI